MKHIVRMLVFGCVVCLPLSAYGGNEPQDKFGKPDKIILEYAAQKTPGKWVVAVILENDEALAAITVPVRFGKKLGDFKLDSVIFRDTRISYFALKTTNNFDTSNTVLVGLLANLGDNRPPLPPGKGPVAYLYFTQSGDPIEEFRVLTLDSTFFPPFNTLELVSASAEPITPIFETRFVDEIKLQKSAPPAVDSMTINDGSGRE